MKPVWIFGAGGHARVVIDTLRSTGLHEPAGVLDDVAGLSEIDGVPIVGAISRSTVLALGVSRAIIAIGDFRARSRLDDVLGDLVAWETIVHASGYVAPGATIDAGTVVCAGAVVQPGSRIGRHAILNTACSVDHDGRIGDFAQIGPGAHLGGGVTVGRGTFLGIGVSVLPGVTIGSSSIVGAGATVIDDLPDEVTAVGVPARVIDVRAG